MLSNKHNLIQQQPLKQFSVPVPVESALIVSPIFARLDYLYKA